MEVVAESSREGSSGEEQMMDPSVILQAINNGVGGGAKERVIKRQRRGNRMKVYDNGFIFTYDKDSQCGQKSFWRCERKSECQARVHTNPATNQIIKRINEHTHEPPNREDLPPWLVLSQTQSDTSEDGMNVGMESTTGVLINANSSYSNGSATAQLAKIIDRELGGMEAGETTSPEDLFSTVKDEPQEEHAIPIESPPKKKKKSVKKEGGEWPELVELTRKFVQHVWNGKVLEESGSSPSCSCSQSLLDFLTANNLSEHASRVAKFSLERLKQLSQADCVTLLQNEPDGILLHLSLKNTALTTEPSSCPQLTLFLAPRTADDEAVYQMLVLQEKTPAELRDQMIQNGLLPAEQPSRLCVEGPNKIKVELNQKMLASWTTESVLQFAVAKGVCLLTRIS